jgi:RimJ/RimL family protein N-acetyltransferase
VSYQTKKINLRPASYEDIKNVLSWRNEPTTITNMKTKRRLDFNEHEPWFKKSINDPNCVFLIIEVDHEAIGQLRYDLENYMAKVSINITAKWHGKGVASKAFRLGSAYIKRKGLAKIVFARVLKTNIGSIRGMQNAGFKIVKEFIYEDKPNFYMIHELEKLEG